MRMLGLDREYSPAWLPKLDHPALVEFGAGSAEIDSTIERWFASACHRAMAHRRRLQPQTRRFAIQLDQFDRWHAATPGPRRRLIWRLPALSIAINRLLHDGLSDQATLWRCCRLHLDDFAELKASGFPNLPVAVEYSYALMASTFLRAVTEAEHRVPLRAAREDALCRS
jgi:hypothetical protein